HKNKELLEKYLKNRGEFEKYITDNERNIQEISRKRRQSSKSIDDICNYYRVVLDAIDNKKYDLVYQSFSYLQKSENNLTERQNVIADKYHTFLDKIPKCDVCGGFIDGYSTENQNIHNCCKE
ncbi:TPA: death-on-curing family protein, partial [Staphylococcus aureus]|nr:death-on-curing family protein [Staphylococcus aureus]